jgi:hypothetical protein
MAARAFGEHGVLAVQFHAELEVLAVGSPSLPMPMVAGGHALDAALLVVQHFGRGKAGKISTPSASACCAIHLTTFARLTT